jgi:hypothetical protein
MSANPFGVLSPEQLDAKYIAENFVDVFTDLPRLRDKGNTFISGARGTGKSMLLRSMEPEVLLLLKEIASYNELEFFGVHVPIRKVEFAPVELTRLSGYASTAIGEHLLTMQVVFRIASALKIFSHTTSQKDACRFARRYIDIFIQSGGTVGDIDLETATPHDLHAFVESSCEKEIIRIRQYYKRLPFSSDIPQYYGALVGFIDFLVPIAEEVSRYALFGKKIPLYIMLDDADNLPRHLQRILNSWISTRSTHAICLKITTQLGYATFRTVDNRLIESPHDFSEVDLSAIYTNENATYFKKIEQIIQRRFQLAGINATPSDFFPRDEQQANRLAEIEVEIESQHEARNSSTGGGGGPRRVRDEVIRTAIPRLMRELAGSSRSSHTYSYSGFRSLVDLSSGVIRWFLEPASRMYDRVVSNDTRNVSCSNIRDVPVAIQDKVIADWAREFVQKLSALPVGEPDGGEFEQDETEASLHAIGHETELYERLRNLIDGLGLLFRNKLLDETASEQRVFSVVLRGKPSKELVRVLELGVRLGYLQRADNAPKETVGLRLTRYMLARRLGPYYRLDVSGYAAHLSIMAEDLELSMRSPHDFVKKRLKQGDMSAEQLPLELGDSGKRNA